MTLPYYNLLKNPTREHAYKLAFSGGVLFNGTIITILVFYTIARFTDLSMAFQPLVNIL